MSDNRNTCANPYMESFTQSFAEANYKLATIKAYHQLVHRLGRLMDWDCPAFVDTLKL
ncbi:MAG: hypothetical protein ACYCZB_17945 [Acidiphilium sp.]